ncbi:hypothetical protein JOE51_006307 [Bradyrhizobium japonicum]|nr:hypothetical protein [Bradyrhizobium japonicum]
MLADAQAQLAAWLAASAAVASSQSYEIETGNGRRKLQRADAAEIRQQIEFWDARVTPVTQTSLSAASCNPARVYSSTGTELDSSCWKPFSCWQSGR